MKVAVFGMFLLASSLRRPTRVGQGASSPSSGLGTGVLFLSGISESWSSVAGCIGAGSPNSVPLFLSLLHVSRLPACPARDSLHPMRSHSLHLSMKPTSGILDGLLPGYRFVLSNSIVTLCIPRSWELIWQLGPDPLTDQKSPLLISLAFVQTRRRFLNTI